MHLHCTSNHDNSTLEGHKKGHAYPERASNNQTSGSWAHPDL